MLKLAVFGNPIKQSKSPIIHQQFAAQFELPVRYTAELSDEHSFKQDAQRFLAQPDAVGCNITAPFKQQAFEMAAQLSPAAATARAVNTLQVLEDGQLKGFNTDGGGLVNDILAVLGSISGSRVLLIGAGGAARGVLVDLLNQHIAWLTISNRTLENAQALADICNGLSSNCKVTACNFADIPKAPFDLIINATSLSLHGDVPQIDPGLFAGSALVYDMVYGDKPTAFLTWAQRHGASQIRDGLGMLIGQAALSFAIWTGKQPDVAPVMQFLREQD